MYLFWHLTLAVVIIFSLLKRVEFAPVGASLVSVCIMAPGFGEWAFLLTSFANVA